MPRLLVTDFLFCVGRIGKRGRARLGPPLVSGELTGVTQQNPLDLNLVSIFRLISQLS